MTLRITDENRRWWLLATMTGSLSMILIDETVVSVALPTMQRDLDLSTTGLQWVVNAYLLAIAVFVALGGRAGDILGNARIFRIGAALFVLASASSGFAQSEAWIILSRVLQGVGAALMTPATGAIVTNAFAPSERGRAMGVYAGISMIFLALGPLIGGLLVEWISWRAVFFINLPVGAVMLAMARFTVRHEEPRGGTVDWGGVPLIMLSLGCLVLGLMQSRTWGWGSSAVISLLVAAAVLLPLTVWWELRQREPLVQLRLFANRNFLADNVVLLVVQFALMGVSVFGAIWVQDVIGFSAIEAGLSLLPLTLPLLLLAARVGSIYDRVGPRGLVTAGCGLACVALLWIASVMSELSYWWLVPGYVLLGLGLALVMSPANTDAMNAAPAAMRGQASGVIQTMRQVGATLGIAVLGTIVANVQLSNITSVLEDNGVSPERVPAVEQQINAAVEAGGGPPHATHVSPELVHEIREAITSAISSAYYAGAGILLIGTVVAWALLRRQRPVDMASAAAEERAAAT